MNAGDNFDFDEWAALAQRDPAGFEAKRRAVLQARIDAIPESHAHLREKLSEAVLAAAPTGATPLERAAGAFSLMQDSMVRLVDAHGALAQAIAEAPDERLRIPAAQRFTRFVIK